MSQLTENKLTEYCDKRGPQLSPKQDILVVKKRIKQPNDRIPSRT